MSTAVFDEYSEIPRSHGVVIRLRLKHLHQTQHIQMATLA